MRTNVKDCRISLCCNEMAIATRVSMNRRIWKPSMNWGVDVGSNINPICLKVLVKDFTCGCIGIEHNNYSLRAFIMICMDKGVSHIHLSKRFLCTWVYYWIWWEQRRRGCLPCLPLIHCCYYAKWTRTHLLPSSQNFNKLTYNTSCIIKFKHLSNMKNNITTTSSKDNCKI